MIKGVSVAYIHSNRGKKLSKWYADVLGLPIRAKHPGWTEFDQSCGSRFAIDHVSAPLSDVEQQAVMISFEVDDIHAAVEELSRRGVLFYPTQEDTVFDVGPSLVATFKDPDGNWVQLNEIKGQQ